MDFDRIASITVLVFAVLTLYFNFISKPINFPGDFYLDKIGIKFYLPILSTIILSVIITFLLSMLPK